MNNENVEKKSLLHKLYGGLHMSWPVVLLYAVFAAALTFAFLAPVLAFLGVTAYDAGTSCLRNPPHLLVTALFCILQIALYVLAFFPEGKKKLIGFAVPVAAAVVMALAVPQIDIMSTQFLPDDPVFTEEAVVKAEEGAFADVSLAGTGDDSRVMVRATSYGSMVFSVLDGDAEYQYTLTVYEDESGHTQILITER